MVKRGEYLKLIADRYALSNQELADLTPGLTAGSSLLVGQRINVPVNEATTQKAEANKAEASKSEAKTEAPNYPTENYQVQRGDTLSSIANQAKISLAELASLNNLTTQSGVRIGQSLKVPAGVNVPERYTVQRGDTLSAISTKYNLSQEYIAELNNISRNGGLRAGQSLKLTGDVPDKKAQVEAATETANDIHVVKAGETLSSIARQYKLQLSYLAELNELSRTANVRIGQRLKVDASAATVDAKAEVSNVAKSSSTKATEAYRVKSGESLNSIANRVGISVAELASLNGLTPRSGLQIGQSIQIPKTVTEYKVKRGDTLIGLANRYGIDSKALADLNDMQPNTQLRIGDVIKVPNL